MGKITINDFDTNCKMLNEKVLRYVETFSDYLSHLQNFFREPLNGSEMRWLLYLIERLKLFLKGAPETEKYKTIVSRYQRVLTRLEKIQYEESRIISSSE